MKHYALITGGSGGIGKELAYEFAKDGYNLVLVADKEAKLHAAAKDLATAFPALTVIPIVKDLTYAASPREIFDELNEKRIVVVALVNDAGVGNWGEFTETALEKDLYIMRLNMEALVQLTKLFLPPMLARGEGKILNVGSIAGFQPGPLLAVYHATKAFVVSFSLALAEELKERPVIVTCLCPGATGTNFFKRAHMEQARIVHSGMIMDARKVAAGGYAALKRGDPLYIPGTTNKMITFMRRMLPGTAQAKLNKKIYEPVTKH